MQGHVANAFFQHAQPIPTVIDLYDPFIIENLHYYAERGAEVFQHDHFTLMNSLVRGDFFLCASEAQRLFYLGAAARVRAAESGRCSRAIRELESLIAHRAVRRPAAARPSRPRDLDAPAILFGGIYDWYDPITAIDAVALVRSRFRTRRSRSRTIRIPSITPQGKLAEAMEHVRKNGYEFVRFEPWAPYEQRAEFFERFALALLTFPRSLETDLSMRTRIYDYLWCGLPIVTSSAPGTDEILARYERGIVVDEDAPRAFADAIVRDRCATASATSAMAARRAARSCASHQWDRTLRAAARRSAARRASSRRRETFARRAPAHPASARALDPRPPRSGGSVA